MSTEPIDPKTSARAFYAAQLRRLRTEAKLTQSELGGHPAVMVSGKLIGHVENCYRPPTRRLSQGLDRAFGLTDFFEGMYAAIKRESGPTSDFLGTQSTNASLVRSRSIRTSWSMACSKPVIMRASY